MKSRRGWKLGGCLGPVARWAERAGLRRPAVVEVGRLRLEEEVEEEARRLMVEVEEVVVEHLRLMVVAAEEAVEC